MSFWGELKRRNVYKVGVAYAIVAWLLIQAAAIVSPALQLPNWMLPVVIILLCIGFPIAILLAWAYEVTPEGIKRTKEVPLADSITHLTGQKLNYIVTGLLVVAVAFLVIDNYLIDRSATEPEMVSTESKQIPAAIDVEKAKKTIAVLPFVNLSSDPEQEYFVDGLSEEILNSLCQIPDLNVTGRTSSFSFKGTNKKVQEIANELGVENILEGSVRKAGNALRITAQLLRGADGFHLWSKTYDRELKDIFAVQEDIAMAVSKELKVTLGIGKFLKQLGGTHNVKAYEHYMIAEGHYNYEWNLAIKSLDAALELDPKFALAWASKSIIHTFFTITGSANRVAIEKEKGLHAAQKAVELEPNMAAGYYSLGYTNSISGNFLEAGLAYRKALDMTNEPLSFIMPVVAVHYIAVGYFKKANELLEEMLRNDPINEGNHGFYIWSYGLLGDTHQAEEEYEHAKALFGDKFGSVDPAITDIRLATRDILSRDDIVYSNPVYDTAKEHLDSPKEGLAELRRLYNDDDNLTVLSLQGIVLWAAYFGDPEFAMDVLDKTISINAESILFFWFPKMREVRQLPRFKELVREVGLVDYWNEFGWPDLCHQLDNGDFVCD